MIKTSKITLKAKKVSFVLPTYDEKENITTLIDNIIDVMKNYPYNIEIIVVDDDSPDKTWQVVSKISRRLHNVKIVRRVGERGIASAIYRGITESKGEYIVWMDCDMSMPPKKVPELLQKLDEGYDIAIGSRYVEGGKDSRPFIRKSTSHAFNIYAKMILGYGIKDYDSGFIAVKRNVFKKVKFPAQGYGEYFIEFVYKAAKKGFKIVESGYNNVDRIKGESKTANDIFTLLKYGLKYGVKVIKIRIEK